MTTQTINPEREWADGMDQQDFEVAYRRKFGNVDVIPSVNEWIYKYEPGYKGIDPINMNDLQDDFMSNLANAKRKEIDDNKAKEEAGECICSGCGKKAKSMFGLKAHQRHCKPFKELG